MYPFLWDKPVYGPKKTEEPARHCLTGSFHQFDGFTNGENSKVPPIIIPLTFPNVSHKFWDNYRLTKQYYVRPTLV
jgi:hypothetical protein